MRLSGSTMINEYAFLLGESKYFIIFEKKDDFGQVTCFANFSNQRHKVYNFAESQR